jgi:hypothetical protein
MPNHGIRIRFEDTGDLADWLEAKAILEDQSKISRSRLRRQLRELFPSDEAELEIRLELIYQEMRRRRQVAGEIYPFVEYETGTGMKLTGLEGSLPYVFLLCLSVSEPLRAEKRQQEVEYLFDLVVMEALHNYLSGNSEVIHFGWPPTGARPKSFCKAVPWLAQELGIPTGKGVVRTVSKDGGLDVVAWKPFRDDREGFVAILAQCTIKEDWFDKAKDIVKDVWRGYIDFGKDPTSCLAVPFVVPMSFDKWDELRRTVTFLLDRLRLCELIEETGLTCEEREEIEEWTNSELERMSGNGTYQIEGNSYEHERSTT